MVLRAGLGGALLANSVQLGFRVVTGVEKEERGGGGSCHAM